MQGTKRRASLDGDNLGPPAKVQKRNDHAVEQEADVQESSGEIVADGEDSDSQLSLASQPSQSEPAVVLSSPDDKPGSGTAEQEEGEPPKSEEAIDSDDDNVFVEEETSCDKSTTGTDEENNVICDRSEATAVECIEDQIAGRTESAMDTDSHSAAVGVGSPEISPQSEQSSTVAGLFSDSPMNQASDEGNLEGGVSSEERMEVEQGDGGSRSVEQKQSNLEHDHSYFSSSLHQNPPDGDPQSRSSSVPVAKSAELTDHVYCNTTNQVSPRSQPAQQPQHEPNSPETQTDLRSKLSSDVQDHNYCRLSPPATSPTTLEAVTVEDTNDTRPEKDDSGSITESQELFSVDILQQENLNLVDAELHHTGPSTSHKGLSDTAVTLVHVGCQTNALNKPETAEKSTSVDDSTSLDTLAETSINSSLKSVIDELAARDDLATSTLWRVHHQLLRGLSLVSEKLRSESS